MSNSSRNYCYLFTAIAIVSGAIVGFVALGKSFVEVPPGNVGIIVTHGNLRAVLPGRHRARPYVSDVEMISTKTQLLNERHIIPTKEGLAVTLDTAITYHVNADKAATLFKDVGSNYEEILLAPASASVIRSLTSEAEAKALYTEGRDAIQAKMKERLQSALEPRGLTVEGVFLKDVILPEQLSYSIELKAQAEQDAARMKYELDKKRQEAENEAELMKFELEKKRLEAENEAELMKFELEKERQKAENEAELMKYTLEKERQEAERKAVEAGGVADYQRIISEGISDNLLKYKGIEATEKLAGSGNSKLIIMGGEGGNIPFLMNGVP